ncbi:rhodanese [Methylobacterium sp. V23]|nr:rhodanese [Methylobacterium sp. V23]
MSPVTAIPACPPAIARAHFRRRLELETDCADVAAALGAAPPDFVLLHAVGSAAAFRRRHIPGAVHLPHHLITAERLAAWPPATLFVVYCAGPHCNGADRAALRLAEFGRPVKLMLGGLTGWADEALAFAGDLESTSDLDFTSDFDSSRDLDSTSDLTCPREDQSGGDHS